MDRTYKSALRHAQGNLQQAIIPRKFAGQAVLMLLAIQNNSL
jgi:hypothetical protein